MILKNSFYFNGIKKPYITTISKGRPVFAPIRRNLITIPGMPGAHLDSTDTLVRMIPVRVWIEGTSPEDYRKITEDFSDWLITEKAEELIFEDELDRKYYAVVDGNLDPEEIVNAGFGTITFICLDPYKYGEEEEADSQGEISLIINNQGSVEAEPVFWCQIENDTTFVAISDGKKVNMIGMPLDVDRQPYVREERKLWSEMKTLVGWSDTTSVEEGINTGTMKSDGSSFYTDTYGAATGWHGPAKKTSIGSSIQDFQIDALVRQIGSAGQVGSIEIALLDVNNQFVAKLLLTKRSKDNQAVWARLRAGNTQNGHDIMNDRGSADWVWADFDGILRLSRIGNVWEAWVARSGSGEYHSSLRKRWIDSQGIATAPITQVQVQLWQHGTVPTTNQKIDDIKVFKINNGSSNTVPYVARAGDIIKFDHVNDIILRNGEDITKEKAFIGEYFHIPKGQSTVVAEPGIAITKVEAAWTPRWR